MEYYLYGECRTLFRYYSYPHNERVFTDKTQAKSRLRIRQVVSRQSTRSSPHTQEGEQFLETAAMAQCWLSEQVLMTLDDT